MKKRILALVLTVVMLLSLVPGQAFAAQTETVDTEQIQQSVHTHQEEDTTPSEETTETEIASPTEVLTQESEQSEHNTSLVPDESYPLSYVDKDIVADMTYLVETLGIRQAGSENEFLAQEYVAQSFVKLGYEVRTQEVPLTQPIGAPASKNVIATKYGTTDSEMTIYITAHVDSVPRGPGANDNASGIAGMLALARAFQNIKTNYNICFVSFCAEEYGLQGSKYFAQNMTATQKLNAIAAYNLDMIATNHPDCMYMLMMSASNENGSFDNHATVSARNAALSMGYGTEHFNVIQGYNADHASLHDAGIPAAEFFWNKNTTKLSVESYYHTAQDNLSVNFNLDRLKQIVSVVGLAVYNVATANYAAVVGEGAYRDYYTSLEEATAVAAASGETLRQFYSFDLAEGHTHTMSYECDYSSDASKNLDFIPVYSSNISTVFSGGASGNYVLMEDVSFGDQVTVTGMDVNLCLNGHKIMNDNQYAAFQFKGTGTLNICDCSRSQSGAFYSNHTQALIWMASSSFNVHLYSGQIYDKEKSAGNWTMGIYNAGGNTYIHSGDIYSFGQGIRLNSDGDVYVTGGTIKAGNQAVYIEKGNFHLSGDPVINGNVADFYLKTGAYITIDGPIHPANGDVYTIQTQGTPTVAAPIRFTSGWGDNKGDTDKFVFESASNDYFVIEIEDADGNKELYLKKKTHYHDKKDFVDIMDQAYMETLSNEGYYMLESGYYRLTDNLVLDKTMLVNGDKEVHICLNGYTITSSAQGIFQASENGKLFIHDCFKKANSKEEDRFNTGKKVYTNGNGEIHLCGGNFKLSGFSILVHATQQSRIVINGATVYTQFPNGTKFGGAVADGGTIELKAGKLISEGTGSPAVYVDSGALAISGDPMITGGNGAPDIYLTNDNVITVTGSIIPQDGGFRVQIDRKLNIGDDHQLTSGWDKAEDSDIPFIPYDDRYSVREIDGELYLSYVPAHEHEGTEESFTKMLFAPKGKKVNIFTLLSVGGTFYLDGEGEFVILDVRPKHQTTLDNPVKLCLNGRTISLGQSQLSGLVSFCDCTDHGVFNQTGYWQISGDVTIRNVYIHSTTNIESTGQAMTPFLMKKNTTTKVGAKLLIEGCTIDGIGAKKIVGYQDHGNAVTIRNTTLLSVHTGVGVDVETPKLTLGGLTVIDADKNADIRLSYRYNEAGKPSIIELDDDFHTSEGQKITVSLAAGTAEVPPVIKVGAPIQITKGWGVARNAQGLEGHPFEYYPDNIPGNYDDEYEAFEMITDEGDWEIWVGIPHKHYDEDGNVIAKYYYHITQNNVDKFKWDKVMETELSFVGGTYYMLEDATIPVPLDKDGNEIETPIINRGDMDLCLNDHTLDFKHEFVVDAVDSTVTVDDCGDEGTAIFQSYQATNGRLILLGGTIIGVDPNGASRAWEGREIVVDGATLISTATASDSENNSYDAPYSKMCAVITGNGEGSSVTMKSGTIKKQGVDGNAVLIYGGSYKLEGTMDIDCLGNYADFYFYNHIPIEITGKVTPPADETYSVEIRYVLKRGETYRITEGWSERGDCDYIPFVSTQGYIVYLEPTDGEIYLTPPQVTVTVNDESMGSAFATPDHGPGGNDYYGNVRTPVSFTATPNTGYYIKEITMYYTYDIEREYVDKIYKSKRTLDGKEYRTLDYKLDENGAATAMFDMPMCDVYIHVVFEGAKLEKPVNILMWKDKNTEVTQEMLYEEFLKADPSHTFLKENGNYTFTAMTEDLEVLTLVKTDTGYTFVGTDGGEYNGVLTVSYVDNDTGIGGAFLVDITPMIYDVKNTVFILDYDMAVLMNEGLFTQDILPGVGEEGTMSILPEGYVTKAPDMSKLKSVLSSHTGTYGTFSVKGAEDVLYTPTDGVLLNGSDKIYKVFRVHETGVTPSAVGIVNPFMEVEMYKEIVVVPANVVYYEDSNAVLNWNPDMVAGINIETLGTLYGNYQDGSNSTPHGNDPGYTYTPDGIYNGSGGTSKVVTVTETGNILTFDFTGTGFDLIGKTSTDSGYFIYVIYDANGEIIKRAALDTSFSGNGKDENAAVEEVPFIHVQDLPHGTYHVEIQAVLNYDWDAPKEQWNGIYPPVIPMTLYFDGLRVFNPLAMESDDRGYYAPGEDTASFLQIRNMILNGQAASAKFDAKGNFSYGSGLISYVERANKPLEYEGVSVSSLNEYLLAGPNNEVYINETTQSLVLFVRETGEDQPMLQIGVRNMNPEAFDTAEGDNNNAPYFAVLGSGGKVIQTLVSADKAISYTEQYYTIDYKNCVVDTLNGVKYYRVVITAMNSSAFSLSNLKVSGVEFYTVPGLSATVRYDEFGNLVYTTASQSAELPNLWKIERQIMAASGLLPEDELPAESEELKFTAISLSLRSSIGMNFYVAKQTLEGYSKPYILLSKTVYDKNGKATVQTVKLTDYVQVQVSGQDCFRFDYNDLSAMEMNSNVTVRLYATKDDVVCVMAGESREYSVVQYVKNMLAKTVNRELKTLLVDMVNYGAQAQLYFGYNTANLANAEFDSYQSFATAQTLELVSCADKDAENPFATNFEGTQYGAKILGASLLLEDKVKINLYVEAKDINGRYNEGRDLMIAYTDVNGETVIKELIIEASDLDSNGLYYKVTFDCLNATDMGTPIRAWVAEDGLRISNTLCYSIESYAASVIAGTTAAQMKLQPLVVAMMKYGNAAKTYFGVIQ